MATFASTLSALSTDVQVAVLVELAPYLLAIELRARDLAKDAKLALRRALDAEAETLRVAAEHGAPSPELQACTQALLDICTQALLDIAEDLEREARAERVS